MQTAYTRFARIFTRSADYSDRLTQLGIPPHRLVRLQPGIDTSKFGPHFADEQIWPRLGIPAKSPKLLYCGRISVEKDLPHLAEVWKLLRRRLPQHNPALHPQLILVGDGPYRARMQRELTGDHADVHFLGFRHGEELAAIYASSDLFIFPSTTDTLGQVVMEAQCSGLPVLVSDQGGPSEVVTDGITGRILPINGSRKHKEQSIHNGTDTRRLWIEAILELLEDPARRAAMACAAHKAMQPLTIERSFEHFWHVHEEVAAAQKVTERKKKARHRQVKKAEDLRIRPKVNGEE